MWHTADGLCWGGVVDGLLVFIYAVNWLLRPETNVFKFNSPRLLSNYCPSTVSCWLFLLKCWWFCRQKKVLCFHISVENVLILGCLWLSFFWMIPFQLKRRLLGFAQFCYVYFLVPAILSFFIWDLELAYFVLPIRLKLVSGRSVSESRPKEVAVIYINY